MTGLRELVESLPLPAPDERAARAVAERAANVLRPVGAFARLDEVAAWMASWQSTATPHADRPALVLFAGDHGVAAEGVSAYPAEITGSVLRALEDGVATANAVAAAVGASTHLVDVGVGSPTGNIAIEPAMDDERLHAAFDVGRATVAGLDADLLVVGELGIGNTTSAAALTSCLLGMAPDVCTGRGTGVDDAALRRKIDVVSRACARVAACHPIDALRELGGTELAAIVGAIVEARLRRIPVLLDGYATTAAAAVLARTRPDGVRHCLAGHRSAEPGHRRLLDALGMRPLLELDLRLGEGTGALAAVPLVRIAIRAVTDVATFDEWAVNR